MEKEIDLMEFIKEKFDQLSKENTELKNSLIKENNAIKDRLIEENKEFKNKFTEENKEIKNKLDNIENNHLEHIYNRLNGIDNDLVAIKTSLNWNNKVTIAILGVILTTAVSLIIKLIIS
ncbi:MAG: hypothetical protein LBD03_00300 [Methanobrevibacter sp.]|jgi:hypothetical protein|nr:hypothetical protein [Candidatus Methanovirga procula]